MHRLRGNSGIAMMELILSLMICLLLLPAVLLALTALNEAIQFDQSVQDEIAIQQLRRILSLSYDVTVYEDCIAFRYQGETRWINLKNGNLIMQEGTVMFLTDLDDVSYQDDGVIISLIYERHQQTYLVPLAKKS